MTSVFRLMSPNCEVNLAALCARSVHVSVMLCTSISPHKHCRRSLLACRTELTLSVGSHGAHIYGQLKTGRGHGNLWPLCYILANVGMATSEVASYCLFGWSGVPAGCAAGGETNKYMYIIGFQNTGENLAAAAPPAARISVLL